MKGISPLIAAVLLIAFTVSIATIILGWFSSFTKGTTANISSQTQTAIGCSAADITVNHIYCKYNTTTHNSTCNILVTNTGTKILTSVSAMIVNNIGGFCTGNLTTENLTVGSTKSINLEDCPVNSTTFSRAIVTTECPGVSYTVTSTSYVTFS